MIIIRVLLCQWHSFTHTRACAYKETALIIELCPNISNTICNCLSKLGSQIYIVRLVFKRFVLIL